MSIPQHRVQALASHTKPSTKKGLKSFIGAIGFYRRYVEQGNSDPDPSHIEVGSCKDSLDGRA